ncbi:GNAT family N-acetyltransferase [Nocardia cyriacigeorgica]|uniref:GNAT family N-acetyltransferase n=1 Tax=Nocardia cyriacigeorgica TaxID=135487 RepID=A0A5R8PAJ1_9NOCA|nr:GNAT family protein [Nocardia cyriacigeorgica]TLG05319.1 GNAT family N-acetyltransferase [Nocardia cyriacigeorgica]
MIRRLSDLSAVELGPVRLFGATVVLRPPRVGDAAAWRRIRLRDRLLIEPFWHTSELDWAARHSDAQWARELVTARAEACTGRRLACVIEINGRLAGQCDLVSVDRRTGSAELSIWIDATLARHGFGGLAASLVLDFGFDRIGLDRIVAPVAPQNVAAVRGAADLGFCREARMVRYFDAGGARRDHELWALTRADIPRQGFTGQWLQRAQARHPARRVRTTAEPPSYDGPDAITVVAVSARYALGRLRRRFQAVRSPGVVSLAAGPGVVVRSLRLSDGAAWRRARRDGRAHSPTAARPASTPSYGRWVYEWWCGRTGLRTSHGLVFAIVHNDSYAGEATLFGLDMFDRNAWIHLWIDPDVADRELRVTVTRRLLEYGFEQLGLYRIAMAVEEDDTESAVATARSGLVKEGTMRAYAGPRGRRADHGLWAVTVGQEVADARVHPQ